MLPASHHASTIIALPRMTAHFLVDVMNEVKNYFANIIHKAKITRNDLRRIFTHLAELIMVFESGADTGHRQQRFNETIRTCARRALLDYIKSGEAELYDH